MMLLFRDALVIGVCAAGVYFAVAYLMEGM